MDRVGTVNGRLAIWPSAASVPEYMFPPDTVHGLTARAVNTRLEVVLTSSGAGGSVYIWRAGQLVRVGTSVGWGFTAFNNRGTLIVSTVGLLYNYFTVVRSPFSPAPAAPRRHAGFKCETNGRYATASVLNDEDEILATIERSPSRGSGRMWIAIPDTGNWLSGGCLDLAHTIAYPSGAVGVTFTVLGAAGRIGGATSTTYPTAVVSDGHRLATIDELIANQPTPRLWHVTAVHSIDREQVITARAVRLSDNASVLVKLTPVPR
jgi:hypothetical protein